MFFFSKWAPLTVLSTREAIPNNLGESVQLRKWSCARVPRPTRKARRSRLKRWRLNHQGLLSRLNNHNVKPKVSQHMGKPRNNLLLSPSPVKVAVSLLLAFICVQWCFYCHRFESNKTPPTAVDRSKVQTWRQELGHVCDRRPVERFFWAAGHFGYDDPFRNQEAAVW